MERKSTSWQTEGMGRKSTSSQMECAGTREEIYFLAVVITAQKKSISSCLVAGHDSAEGMDFLKSVTGAVCFGNSCSFLGEKFVAGKDVAKE